MTDLHIHTHYSDGSDACAELIKNLKTRGITTFAVTDHDNIGGVQEIRRLGSDGALGFNFIAGVEISSIFEKTEIHLLGYGFDENNPALLKMLKNAEKNRREKLIKTLAYLKANHNIEFDAEESAWLKGLNLAGKPHIARLLVARGFGGSVGEVILKYLDACKVPELKTDAREAFAVVNGAGGVMSLAHPKEIMREYNADYAFIDVLSKKLKAAGLCAIEAYHSSHNADEILRYKKTAEKNNLLISGGSDYHGTLKSIRLGGFGIMSAGADDRELTILTALKSESI